MLEFCAGTNDRETGTIPTENSFFAAEPDDISGSMNIIDIGELPLRFREPVAEQFHLRFPVFVAYNPTERTVETKIQRPVICKCECEGGRAVH